MVPAQITLPIPPASRPREPFSVRDTGSSIFVPFLCAVAGNHHSRIHEVEILINAAHAGMWNTMILRTQYVIQYVFDNGKAQDRERVDISSWRWIQNWGQDTFMHWVDQEWILYLETSYPKMIFPPGLEHADLTTTCGEILQDHAHDWEFSRHDGRNINN